MKPYKTKSNPSSPKRRKPPYEPSPLGEERNYNLEPESEYRLWRFATIRWMEPSREFEARVILEHIPTQNQVVIYSNHPSYTDAELLIQRFRKSLDGTGAERIYNVFAETTGHDIGSVGPNQHPHITKVKALIWSYHFLGKSD